LEDGGTPKIASKKRRNKEFGPRQEACVTKTFTAVMEQRASKIVNNCFNTNIYSYLETSGG
jgi:hypothetical protein